ncbi:Ankyrin repeat and KH domain-containing protein mask (Multiple ankyrin repeat single KH domain-containing protein) [Durusdinium trenchii]|uniref:Ankyrin repeat and KH domain-containing protein mask (Multiple ankyrin repeat single KH domain-containing protein) n=1 Tax=Durusdinium trenchii TaxID=1381693 RepID=A0ABP0HYK7_9DINO
MPSVAIYAYVLVYAYALRLEEDVDTLDGLWANESHAFGRDDDTFRRDEASPAGSNWSPALVGEQLSAEQVEDELHKFLEIKCNRRSHNEWKKWLKDIGTEKADKKKKKKSFEKHADFLNIAWKSRKSNEPDACNQQLGGLLANLTNACKKKKVEGFKGKQKSCGESVEDIFLHGETLVRIFQTPDKDHLRKLKIHVGKLKPMQQSLEFVKFWITDLTTAEKAAILWAGFWTDASDPEGHKSRTLKERLFDFADRIETQTVHPSTHLGRMAEENGNLANCQGPIANDLKSNMWSFFSFSFVYSMRKKNQDMVVALVHKEMDGARALSESILFNYEVPSLGVAAWGLGFWSPQVLLIDLLGTCSQTSPALREQLFSQLPSWYESAKNMDGFHGWHKNTYPRRSRLSWTCLDCPHASCHLDEHLANQVKQLLQVKRQQDDKDTKLIEAAKEGRAHAVEDLLENGAEVNCQDKKGNTPLWYAVINRHAVMAQLLLKHGAFIDAMNEGGKTPLWEALTGGDDDLKQLMKQLGFTKQNFGVE